MPGRHLLLSSPFSLHPISRLRNQTFRRTPKFQQGDCPNKKKSQMNRRYSQHQRSTWIYCLLIRIVVIITIPQYISATSQSIYWSTRLPDQSIEEIPHSYGRLLTSKWSISWLTFVSRVKSSFTWIWKFVAYMGTLYTMEKYICMHPTGAKLIPY